MTRNQKFALAAALAILIPAALLATATYVVVDIQTNGDDGISFFPPVPLALVEATL